MNKPDKVRRLIEKTLSVKDRPGIGVYSKTSEGDPYFTNGHVLIMGEGLNQSFSSVVPNTEGPSLTAVIAGVRGEKESELKQVPFKGIKCDSRLPATVHINDEPCGLLYGEVAFGDTIEDTKRKIALNLEYYTLLTDLGFNRLLWNDGNSAAIAYKQLRDGEVDSSLTAIIMPVRQS